MNGHATVQRRQATYFSLEEWVAPVLRNNSVPFHGLMTAQRGRPNLKGSPVKIRISGGAFFQSFRRAWHRRLCMRFLEMKRNNRDCRSSFRKTHTTQHADRKSLAVRQH